MHTVYELKDYVLLRTKCSSEYPINQQLALLLSTSGSTGSPKMVRQSYKNLVANMNSIADFLELDEKECAITTLPMNYTYGLSVINSHLLVGGQIVLTEKTMLQKEFWNLVRRKKVTSFGDVPYTYEMLDGINFYQFNIPEIKTMTQAGGKLSPQLHKKIAEYAENCHKKFIIMYGQTEATARMSYLPWGESIKKMEVLEFQYQGESFIF